MVYPNEFRIEYSSTKTFFWMVFGLIFSLVFLLVGAMPFLLFAVDAFKPDDSFFAKFIVWCLPLIVWPLAYAMFISAIRHLKNSLSGLSLAVLTYSGISGFTSSGRPISLEWEQVNDWIVQSSSIVLSDRNQIDSFLAKFIADTAPFWNPKAVCIQLIYGCEKFDMVLDAFYALNPYAHERFG